MRPLFLAGILSLGLLAAACHKTQNGPGNSSFYGNWQYLSASGGIGGATIYPPRDSTYVLSLYDNGKYDRKLNGKVYEAGAYSLSPVSTNNIFRLPLAPISFSGTAGGPQQLIRVGGDTLSLAENVYDGFGYSYKRVQ